METETEARRKRARSGAEEDEIAVSDTRHAGVVGPRSRGGSVGAPIADEDEVAGYSEDGEGLRVRSLHVNIGFSLQSVALF